MPVSQVLLRRLLRLRGGVRLACGGGAEGVPHRRGLRPCTRHLRPRVCGALQALPWSVSCRVLWSAWGALFCGAARRSVRPAADRGLAGLFSLLRMLRFFCVPKRVASVARGAFRGGKGGTFVHTPCLPGTQWFQAQTDCCVSHVPCVGTCPSYQRMCEVCK